MNKNNQVKFDAGHVEMSIKKSVDFWSSIDGKALSELGKQNKEMDLLGPKKESERKSS